jgi:hypothetical protein
MKRCCGAEDHLTNMREKRKFVHNMGEAMAEMKETIRDVVFVKKKEGLSKFSCPSFCWLTLRIRSNTTICGICKTTLYTCQR